MKKTIFAQLFAFLVSAQKYVKIIKQQRKIWKNIESVSKTQYFLQSEQCNSFIGRGVKW